MPGGREGGRRARATPAWRDFRLERLADGVFAAVARPEGYGMCNAGIVDLGGATLVFDTMLTPRAGADLVRAARRSTGRSPMWAVNSHWHGDHVWGNPSFGDARIVSSSGVRDDLRARSRRQLTDDRREFRRELAHGRRPDSGYPERDRVQVEAWFRGVLSIPTSYRVRLPEVTFDRSMTVRGDRRSVEIGTLGGGHSPHDVFAFLPDERILFVGDLAVRGYHPSVGDGRPAEWIDILRSLERRRPATVVPGHGTPGGPAVLASTRRYLVDLQTLARGAIRRRVPREALSGISPPDPYRDWGFSFMFPGNLARAIARLRAAARKPRA